MNFLLWKKKFSCKIAAIFAADIQTSKFVIAHSIEFFTKYTYTIRQLTMISSMHWSDSVSGSKIILRICGL